MTQVARGVGPSTASRPGVALPIRIHDLLLTLAGRLDDDALADARQMLASAELDRSLEFLAGCLVAGRVVLTREQHAELAALFADTYLDSAVIERLMVTDRVSVGRHRFAIGSVDGREPERGVADAVRPVLGVLPDVRSIWCVWRLTPAGPSSGPVPHLLVVVGIGPGGFPPATAYRVEDALRRAGIRASVEVLTDGIEPGEYHREAMRSARQIPFDGPGFNRPRVEPAYEAARIAPARVEAPRMAPPPEPPRLEPARVAEVPPEPPRIEPPKVEPPRMAVVRDLPPAVDAPRIDSPDVEIPVRKDPPFSDGPIDQPTMMAPATGGLIGASGLTSVDDGPVEDRVEAVRKDPFEPPAPPPVAEEQPAVRDEPRTDSKPSPTPRQDPPSRPRLAPAPTPASGVDKHSQAFVDDILNTQERNLLKELQDELARREQQDPPRSSDSGSWRVDRSGRHGKPPSTAGPFDHPNQTTGPMIINGVPPQDRGYPPAN
ncbi:hypothetical protein [Actinophytocola sp.]|uniref:hypothetical protein n=1 Tax=Actinophytocola sp. TaxID=1872138 RepID=UPI002ED6356D